MTRYYLEYTCTVTIGNVTDPDGERVTTVRKRIEVDGDKMDEEKARILQDYPGAHVMTCIQFDEKEGRMFLETMAPPGSIDRTDLKDRGINLDKE